MESEENLTNESQNLEQNISVENFSPSEQFKQLFSPISAPSNFGVSKNEHPRTAYDPSFLLQNPFLL